MVEKIKAFFGGEHIPTQSEIKALAAEIVAQRKAQREAGHVARLEHEQIAARYLRVQDALQMEIELQEKGMTGIETFSPIDKLREYFGTNVGRTDDEYRWRP